MNKYLQDNRVALLGAVAIFALGLTTSGYVLGDGLRRAKAAERSVTVRGVSERDVVANLATWSVEFSAKGSDLAPVQRSVDAQASEVRDFFRAAGFKPADVSDSSINVSRQRESDDAGAPDRLVVRRTVQLRTNDVLKARQAFARQAELLRDGVEMTSSDVSYTFTRLNALKPEMIAEATQNARRSAEEFARDSGASVGRIKSASQGYFSVGPRDGEECEGCSASGSPSPFQKVRVVTTIDYDLG
ncbi:MAG: SIMPL domain-containing protein [Sphingomicrobium sp.]